MKTRSDLRPQSMTRQEMSSTASTVERSMKKPTALWSALQQTKPPSSTTSTDGGELLYLFHKKSPSHSSSLSLTCASLAMIQLASRWSERRRKVCQSMRCTRLHLRSTTRMRTCRMRSKRLCRAPTWISILKCDWRRWTICWRSAEEGWKSLATFLASIYGLI